jgi:hypothetical protein
VFAPNHPLRPAVTALAVANVGKQRDAATGGHGGDGHGTEGCCDANHATLKPRSHDTSRIAGAKLMARVGEKFPLECPACGGDIRLISFITELGRDRQRFERFAEMCQDPGPENGSRIARVPPASPGGGSNRLTSHSSVGQRLWKCH